MAMLAPSDHGPGIMQKTRLAWYSNAGRDLLWVFAAFVLWYYSSKAVHDLLVWGAFATALPRARSARPVWTGRAGKAFVAVLLFSVLTLPLSWAPADSLRDLVRMARLPAGAFAVSVWFGHPNHLFGALWYSALALLTVLTFDLVRLAWILRDNLLSDAHAYEPFMLNHSNVSSMLAGLSFFVFVAAVALHKGIVRRIAASAGMVICLVYLFVLASRGPQVAFMGSVAVAGLLWVKGCRGRLVWVAAGLLAAGLLWTNMEQLNPRFRDRDEVATFAGRTTVWQHTWRLARQRSWRGYGYGKRVFQTVYQSTDPPPSPFEYPHPHSYFLFVFFQHGWPGLMLYGLAWGSLGFLLARRLWQCRNGPERWLTGLVALLLLMLHLYGLVDYPDNRLAIILIWLVPAALLVGCAPLKNCSRPVVP